MQVPSGALSGSLGPRRTILGFTALTLAGVAVFYIGSSYLQLFAAQLLIGLGCSVFYLNAVILVSAWLPQARRATGIGVLSAVFNLGNFAAYLGFPLAVTNPDNWHDPGCGEDRWLEVAGPGCGRASRLGLGSQLHRFEGRLRRCGTARAHGLQGGLQEAAE